MQIALITGSAGLVGSEAVRFFSGQGMKVIGIDNDMRRTFFGDDASTAGNRQKLQEQVSQYEHHAIDVRDVPAIDGLFSKYSSDIAAVIHAAAQPSHDWAATDASTNFTINANATLTLLEATRRYCPRAAFIFTSSNKVYGDNPNRLPLEEQPTRWELPADHAYYPFGIDEQMSLDQATHSLFGVSKLAADVLVQEYGRNWGLNTVVFRGGCFTGPGHQGTTLHGFLSYLVKCAVMDEVYTIFGYQGKQVRDNMHSRDLVNMFWHFYCHPRPGEVYNAGGGRKNSCSIREAMELCREITGRTLRHRYVQQNRVGDHIWYISDTRKFQAHYPGWSCRCDLSNIVQEIHDALIEKFDR